jgi:hypothetical protein
VSASVQHELFIREDLAERLDATDDPLIVLLDLTFEAGWMWRSHELHPASEAVAQEATRLVAEIELLLASIQTAIAELRCPLIR